MDNLYTLDEALDYLNETNFTEKIKESISTAIKNIKQTIINFISKIQKFLEKCKDSKVKSSINGILTKAKAALGDAEALEKLDEEKQEQQRNAVNKLAEDIKSLVITFKIVSHPETFSETIHLGDIKNYIKPKLDDNKNYIAFVGYEKNVIDKYQKISKVDIIKNDEGHNLLILRDAKVVIDLFNFTREMFVGDNKTDEYIEEILKEIGCESFVFLSLKEAIMANDIFRHTDNEIILNKGVISQGGSMFGEELWRFTLTKLFHGKHNWASNISYLAMKEQLKDSIYRHQVMCYESCSYIREEKDFIIEVEVSNEIDSLEIVPIIIFSLNKQNPSDIQLRFHGLFELDKNRSLQDNHVTLRCIESSLKV